MSLSSSVTPRNSLYSGFVFALLASSVAVLTTGCGLGTAAGAGAGIAPVTYGDEVIGGKAMGGYQPIFGAYAQLYQSQNNGYGGAGALVADNLMQSDGGVNVNGHNLTGLQGEFSFTVGSTCTPGSVIYVVISGGNSGAASSNNQILEMAPVETCGATGKTVAAVTIVNELSTVATGYAMGNFMSIDSTAVPAVGAMTGPYVVNMSAPPNNNYSSTGGATVPTGVRCTAAATFISTGSNNVSSGTTCTASGLAHAYANVGSMVNVSVPSTSANTTVQANTASDSSGVSGSSVPAALINTIASVLQSCVNSIGVTAAGGGTSSPAFTGNGTAILTLTAGGASHLLSGTPNFNLNTAPITPGVSASSTTVGQLAAAINASTAFSTAGVTASVSGATLTVTAAVGTLTEAGALTDTANDGTNCGKLMALTPAVGSTTPPGNTLQAAMNLAKNPYVSADNVTNFFGLVPPAAAFGPVLAAAPKDWTIALSYLTPLVNDGTNSIAPSFPYVPTLDADDNVYIATSNADQLNGGSANSCILAFAPNGALLSGPTNWGCNKISGVSNYMDIVPDALGNLWTANSNGTGSSSSPGFAVLRFTNTGTPFATPYIPSSVTANGRLIALAVDKNNDVMFTANVQTPPNIQWLKNASGTWTAATFGGSNMANTQFGAAPRSLAMDSKLALWVAEFGSNATSTGGAAGVISPTNASSVPQTYSFTTDGPREVAIFSGTTGVASATPGNSVANGIAIDAIGNAWVSNIGSANYTGSVGISQVLPPSAGPQYPSTGPQPTVGLTYTTGMVAPKYLEVDGANNLWVPDTNGYHELVLGTSAVTEISPVGGFLPCYLGFAGIGTNCATSVGVAGLSRGVAVDSAGDVYVVYPDIINGAVSPSVKQGRLFEIIGTGFPTWPLKSQLQPGFPAGCTKSLATGCN